MYNLGDLKQTALIAVAAITATANSSAVTLPSEPLGEIVALFDVAAGTGTIPTYNAQLQSSPDGSTWTNVGAASPQVTGTAQQFKIRVDAKSLTGLQLRVAETIGGTTPSFTRSVQLISRLQVFP